MSRIRVLDADALVEARPVQVEAFGRLVAVVRYQGKVYAMDDVCPHRAAPLHQGEVSEACLECPLHGWAFSLATGEMSGAPDIRVETFTVVEAEAGIYLEAPPSV